MNLKTHNQRFAVASLIGECEAIVASGVLTEPSERALRLLIGETLIAFGMQHHDKFERDLSAIQSIMGASL